MTQQKILLLPSKQAAFTLITKDIPKPRPGEVIVKIHAAALNPLDWKVQKYGAMVEKYPTIMGSDGAGTVEELGEGVKEFSKGDRVMFQGDYTDDYGTFQQYVSIPAGFIARIPKNLDYPEASTISLCTFTAASGLYDPKLGVGLTPPWDAEGKGKYKGHAAVVLGGASSVGFFAIQLLKLSGFSEIITTASPKNEAFVKSAGATHFIDRKLTLGPAVASAATLPITVVLDAVSDASTQASGYEVLGPEGSLITFLGNQVPPERQSAKKAKVFPMGCVFTDENEPFRRLYYSKLTRFIEENNVVPNKVEVLPGGLNGITAGLDRLEKNLVSASKLVVLPQETA